MFYRYFNIGPYKLRFAKTSWLPFGKNVGQNSSVRRIIKMKCPFCCSLMCIPTNAGSLFGDMQLVKARKWTCL